MTARLTGGGWLVLGSVFLLGGCGRGGALPPLPVIPAARLESVLPVIREQILEAQRKVESDSRNAEKNGRLAMVLTTNGFQSEASTAYQRARQLEPGNPQWAYFHGHLLAGTGKSQEAMSALREALRLNAGLADARVKLAGLLADTGNTSESATQYQQVLAANPRHLTAHYGYGRLLVQQNLLLQASEHFQKALDIENRVGEVHYAMAMLLQRQGNQAGAKRHLADYERYKSNLIGSFDPVAVALSSIHAGDHPHLLRAKSLFSEGRLTDALSELNLALAANPNSLAAHVHLIWLSGQLGDYAKAEEHYRKALALEPSNPQIHSNWGTLERRRNRYPEAKASLEKALSLDSSNAKAHAELGYVLERLGEADASVEHYRQSVALEPDNQDAHFLLAQVLERMKRYPEAAQHLRKILKPQSSRTPVFLRTLAGVHIHMKQYDAAAQALRQARELALPTANSPLAAAIDGDLSRLAELRKSGTGR